MKVVDLLAHLTELVADGRGDNIVFSSSAAVYGTPDVALVTEGLPKRPE